MKIDYSLHIYSLASVSQLNKLDIIQNSAVRIITGLRQCTFILSLNFEAGFVSITHYIHFILCKYLFEYFSLPITHVSSYLIRNQWDSLQNISSITLPHKTPFLIRALRSLNKLIINLPEICNFYFNPP